jgi:hypothetical protein
MTSTRLTRAQEIRFATRVFFDHASPPADRAALRRPSWRDPVVRDYSERAIMMVGTEKTRDVPGQPSMAGTVLQTLVT